VAIAQAGPVTFAAGNLGKAKQEPAGRTLA